MIQIQTDSVFGWIITGVLAALGYLTSLAIRSNKDRYAQLSQRVDELTKKVYESLPQDINELKLGLNNISSQLELLNRTVAHNNEPFMSLLRKNIEVINALDKQLNKRED